MNSALVTRATGPARGLSRADIARKLYRPGSFLGLYAQTNAAHDLAIAGNIRSFADGAPINTGYEELEILVNGWALEQLYIRDDQTTILRLYGPGDVVGMIPCLGGEHLHLPAYALRHHDKPRYVAALGNGVTTLRVAHARLLQIPFAFSPSLAFAAVERDRLDQADHRARIYAADTGTGRLAGLLLHIASRHGIRRSPGAITITVPLTQAQLGSWIGASRETVARAMRAWRDAQIIRNGRRNITILDHRELARVIDAADAARLDRR